MEKTKEQIEGNKLIAEFMGYKLRLPKGCDYKYWEKETEDDKDVLCSEKKTQYHSSWDWIMPVVKKIDTICSEMGEKLSNESRKQEHLKNPLDNPKHWKSWSYHYVKVYTIDNDIVFKDVVEFIKWYNGCKAVTPKRKN